MAITDVASLRQHLQWAMSVELSLIPVYLYAMYSVKDPGSEAFRLIRSVVAEEMLHAALDANMLVAVGGNPSFYAEGPPARYPIAMPHHDPPLELELAPLSADVLELFVTIEKPRPVEGMPEDDNYETQGQFYLAIEEAIDRFGAEAFADPQLDRQLSKAEWYGVVEFDAEDSGGLHAVTDVASAEQAIETVIHQGEGLTDELWADPEHRELTHYHKFLQIAQEGIGTDTIWPLVTNPLVEDFPERLRPTAEFCNAAYSALLVLLDDMYRPMADTERGELVGWLYRVMNDVVGPLARYLVTQPLDGEGSPHAGPTFERYPFSSPDKAFDELKEVAEQAAATTEAAVTPAAIVHDL